RVFRPCDRHDASGAVELRNVERNLGLAFTIDLNGAGEEGDQLFGRRIALGDQSAAVAAGTDAAEGASRSVDQPAVEVPHLDAQPALAEIEVDRGRGRVAGEIEDADIDGSHHHI